MKLKHRMKIEDCLEFCETLIEEVTEAHLILNKCRVTQRLNKRDQGNLFKALCIVAGHGNKAMRDIAESLRGDLL